MKVCGEGEVGMKVCREGEVGMKVCGEGEVGMKVCGEGELNALGDVSCSWCLPCHLCLSFVAFFPSRKWKNMDD